MRLILPLALSLLTIACTDKGDTGDDGTTTSGTSGGTTAVDSDGDGFDTALDCDDTNADINPDAAEVCDGADNDCDGNIDNDASDAGTWYTDADGDGYGDDSSTETACDAPAGAVADGGDCDDTDTAYNPGATEDDCTDPNDYNCDGSVGYADDDGDGWAACEECDDDAAEVNPDATELCDGIDNDCDKATDEDDAADAATWYADADFDGYGSPDDTTQACSVPKGTVANDADCDDADPTINPEGDEVCDGADNDCDGATDDEDKSVDLSTTADWYTDADGDGYGDPALSERSCSQPSGTVLDNTDCDDDEEDINPAATEICNDIDDNCSGATDDEDRALDASTGTQWFTDDDSDGYGDSLTGVWMCEAPLGTVDDDADCDDTDAAINPDATEVCDEADNNCDGLTDDDDPLLDLTSAPYWYTDSDRDGYGEFTPSVRACDQPLGVTDDNTDCDDADAAINPGASEVCDDIDNDCDDAIDDDDTDLDPSTASTYYADVDGDGFGDPDASSTTCDQPDGTVPDNTDCDDDDADINPFADEVCDDADNDCDGDIDDDDFSLDASTTTTWYTDADLDGFGAEGLGVDYCAAPFGMVADGSDCDDSDDAINADAAEVCDEIDNDCDGDIDDADDDLDTSTGGEFYADADRDGYGDENNSTWACEASPGFGDDSTDCDDTDSTVNPSAAEITGDGTDQDCDGYDADYSAEDLFTGDLVITEIMQNPDAVTDANGEWLELKVVFAAGDIDLKGLVLADDSTASETFEIGEHTVVSLGDYVVIGASDDTSANGGAPVEVSWGGFNFSLANSSDGVLLQTASGAVIDEVIWDDGASFPDPTGASMNLDAGTIDAAGNDIGSNWCETSSNVYGDGDYGTPGADNESCAP